MIKRLLAIITIIFTSILVFWISKQFSTKIKTSSQEDLKSISRVQTSESLKLISSTEKPLIDKTISETTLTDSSDDKIQQNQLDFQTLLKQCSIMAEVTETPNTEEFLIRLSELPREQILICGKSITKYAYKFDMKKCLGSIEKMKQTGTRADAYKNCVSVIMHRAWNKYEQQKLFLKPIESMTKEELAYSYHALYFDGRLHPEKRMEKAYLHAVELLKRDPENLNTMNMLIRSSMIQNEKGNGYDETLKWIEKAISKDRQNEALINHFIQRLAYDTRYGLDSVNKALDLAPSYLTAQIMYALYTFKNNDEFIEYYKNLKRKFPNQASEYDRIINHIHNNEDYFFRIVDFNLDTVPDYM